MYYLGISETNDQKTFHALYGKTADDAVKFQNKRDKKKFVSVEERDQPVWGIIAPALVEKKMFRWCRDHLLAGGTLYCDYRGVTYVAVPEMFKKDRRIKDDGKTVVAIGKVTIKVEVGPSNRPSMTFYLDPLDEQHAIDHLNGKLIEFDGQYGNI